MARGKSEEETQQEREAKEQQAQALSDAQRAQQQAEADAAFASSPLGRAQAAHQRNDAFFQLEVEVSALTGPTSFFGSSSNAIQHSAVATDLLGQVEAAGWHLEHVGYVFIETGSTTTDRVLLSGQGMVTQGNVTGIYLFRRAAA